MLKELKTFCFSDDEVGMKLGLVGLLFALVGAILAFWIYPKFGYWVGFLGVIIGLIGIVIHFIKHWREIFWIDQGK